MAELEEKEHGDEGRAREWMTRAVRARRDPAWTADGIVSDRWMPVSPVTGRLDAFQWKDPIADLDADERADRARPRAARRRCAGAGSPPPRDRDRPLDELKPLDAKPVEVAPPPPPASRRRAASRAPRAAAAPIVPLVHVPDDPGPDPQPHLEPETETSSRRPSDSWRKLRGLFK